MKTNLRHVVLCVGSAALFAPAPEGMVGFSGGEFSIRSITDDALEDLGEVAKSFLSETSN